MLHSLSGLSEVLIQWNKRGVRHKESASPSWWEVLLLQDVLIWLWNSMKNDPVGSICVNLQNVFQKTSCQTFLKCISWGRVSVKLGKFTLWIYWSNFAVVWYIHNWFWSNYTLRSSSRHDQWCLSFLLTEILVGIIVLLFCTRSCKIPGVLWIQQRADWTYLFSVFH